MQASYGVNEVQAGGWKDVEVEGRVDQQNLCMRRTYSMKPAAPVPNFFWQNSVHS